MGTFKSSGPCKVCGELFEYLGFQRCWPVLSLLLERSWVDNEEPSPLPLVFNTCSFCKDLLKGCHFQSDASLELRNGGRKFLGYCWNWELCEDIHGWMSRLEDYVSWTSLYIIAQCFLLAALQLKFCFLNSLLTCVHPVYFISLTSKYIWRTLLMSYFKNQIYMRT
jgi:hypothetical protein